MVEVKAPTDHTNGNDTPMQGRRWLVLARLGWVIVTLLTLVLVFASLPARATPSLPVVSTRAR